LRELQGGFVSAAVWQSILQNKLDPRLDWQGVLRAGSSFVTTQVGGQTPSPDPLAVVLANLLVRGRPTLASLFVEEELARRNSLTTHGRAGRQLGMETLQTSFAEDLDRLRPFLERALLLLDLQHLPGSAPGFMLPDYGSQAERAFHNDVLPRALGPAIALVELQRPLATIVEDKRFSHQRVDFCLELPGQKGDLPRGAVFEVDGLHDPKQLHLDAERDKACRGAGWIVIRVTTTNPAAIFQDPGLEQLRAHPIMQLVEALPRNPLEEDPMGCRVLDLVRTPLAVARIQLAIADLLLAGQLDFSSPIWRLCVIEQDCQCGALALKDLTHWIQALLDLYAPGHLAPVVDLTVVSPGDECTVATALERGRKDPFDALLDASVLTKYGSGTPDLPTIDTRCTIAIRGSYRPPAQPIALVTSDRTLPDLSPSPADPLLFFLRNIFRKHEFREKQLEVIERALRRESTIALLPTGAGKSLTYQLAALLSVGLTLVIDPIKSLMKDQVDNLALAAIGNAVFINSTMSARDRHLAGLAMAKGVYKFTFISPERLLIDDFRGTLKSMSLHRFCFAVIDEAHCVSEWGHDFRTAYLRLGENLRRYCPGEGGEIAILGLTGTASYEVLDDIQRELEFDGLPSRLVKPARFARDELSLGVDSLPEFPRTPPKTSDVAVSQAVGEAKQALLPRTLDSIAASCRVNGTSGRLFLELVNPALPSHGAGLIFCPHVGWVHGVKDVYQKLCSEYPEGATYFGMYAGRLADDEGSEELIRTQDDFKQGRVTVLACTKAFGMGIDKPNIRFTVHFNLPQSIEAFYQEAGRAGRDREPAHCLFLYAGSAQPDLPSVDRMLMDSFFQSAFRGQELEVGLLFDLLDVNRIAGQSNIKHLEATLTVQAERPLKCRLWSPADKNIALLYVNEAVGKYSVGHLVLPSLHVRVDHNADKNIALLYVNEAVGKYSVGHLVLPSLHVRVDHNAGKDAGALLQSAADQISAACSGGQDPADWLDESIPGYKDPGLESLWRDLGPQDTCDVLVPFESPVAEDLAKYLEKEHPGCELYHVREAHHYAASPEEFLSKLEGQLGKVGKGTQGLSAKATSVARKAFLLIRGEAETFRCVYRLSILGVIDDYTVDYNARRIWARLRGLPPGGVSECLQAYIGRYVSKAEAARVRDEVQQEEGATELRRAVRRLVRFVYEKIAAKRREAINTMDRTTRAGIEDAVGFTNQIYSYFDSRFTEEFRSYIREYRPSDVSLLLDRVGTDPSDINHLLGSCNRLLTENPENALLRLLRAFALALSQGYGEGEVAQELTSGLEIARVRADWQEAEQGLLVDLAARVRAADPMRAAPFEAKLVAAHVTWLRTFTASSEAASGGTSDD